MAIFPIKDFQVTPTPFYYYDIQLLEQTLEALREAIGTDAIHVHYAMKANANPELLSSIRNAGLGIDCVSGGELRHALQCGFAPESIVFAGVGKTDEEITAGLMAGIGFFNVESTEELREISRIAANIGKTARIALRVNPDIDAHTHEYITTGLAENKFGIDMRVLDSVIDSALALPGISLTGLHFHIGSQITINEPFKLLSERINDLNESLARRGVNLTSINVGGGLGIDYDDPDANPVPDFSSYFETFRRNLRLLPGQELHCELGRAIVAQCGSLISRVIYVKKGIGKQFVILDAGMSDLIRPALYQAHHRIENITAADDAPAETYDVVGPICESSDTFGTDELLPLTHRGDLIALRSAGAYGEVMSSNYNLRPTPPTLSSVSIKNH